ncbi:septin-9-like [Hyperolius riggenbachi]|uniref:septin-9-like n=1 Tax=Hyperolius riggenbachi TaxID=752182 RepID=UPI0035A3BDA3
MRKTSNSGVTRTTSGRQRKLSSDVTSPTLKRSFEVEEVDQSSHPSVQPRRAPNPLLRGAGSAAQKFQDQSPRNAEPLLRHADSGGQRSPKSSLRRIELAGSRHPEPMSRRTEISIDISSKQVENSVPAVSRFGLKRAELPGHKPPEPSPRRAEISLGKPHELRGDVPSSKIPEMVQRRTEESNAKRIEIQMPKSPEVPLVKQMENSLPSSTVPHYQPEPKLQTVHIEVQQQRPPDVLLWKTDTVYRISNVPLQ